MSSSPVPARRSAPARRLLERHVLDPFVRRDRVVTPSSRAWHESGDLLAELAVDEGLDVSRVSKAFGNDVLLAPSCREAGVVLVTHNHRDFERIRRQVPFEFGCVLRLPLASACTGWYRSACDPQSL